MSRGVHVHGVVVWAAATEVDCCCKVQRFSQKYSWNISEGKIHNIQNIHNILSSRHRGWSLLQHAKISWKMHLFGTFWREAMTILDAENIWQLLRLWMIECLNDFQMRFCLISLILVVVKAKASPVPLPDAFPMPYPVASPYAKVIILAWFWTSPYLGNIFHRLLIALLFSRRRWALAVFQLMTSCPMRSEFLVRDAVKKRVSFRT